MKEIGIRKFNSLKQQQVNAPIVFNYCDDVISSNSELDPISYDLLIELEVVNVGDKKIAICSILDYIKDGKLFFSNDEFYRNSIVYVLLQPGCRIVKSESVDKRLVLEYITKDMNTANPTNQKYISELNNLKNKVSTLLDTIQVINVSHQEGIDMAMNAPSLNREITEQLARTTVELKKVLMGAKDTSSIIENKS